MTQPIGSNSRATAEQLAPLSESILLVRHEGLSKVERLFFLLAPDFILSRLLRTGAKKSTSGTYLQSYDLAPPTPAKPLPTVPSRQTCVADEPAHKGVITQLEAPVDDQDDHSDFESIDDVLKSEIQELIDKMDLDKFDNFDKLVQHIKTNESSFKGIDIDKVNNVARKRFIEKKLASIICKSQS